MSMQILCIDVGNTSTHYGVLESGKLIEEFRLMTHELVDADDFIAVAEKFKVRGVAVSSVVPRLSTLLDSCFNETKVPCLSLSPESCIGLKIALKNPKIIGQDLLANALAVQAHYTCPAIVIDMGTATTLNLITEEYGFSGGIIAPGLETMATALHEKTALLPALSRKDFRGLPEGLGKNTLECMQLGCVLGFSGMVEALLNRAKASLSKDQLERVSIICTGGNAEFLPLAWREWALFDPILTLKGLEDGFWRNYDRDEFCSGPVAPSKSK